MWMWMTTASELFHSRRYRNGLRHSALDVSGFDSSQPDAISSSSHQHRTTNRRHADRREHLDVCDTAPRRIHRRRLDHSEHEGEQGSGSIINSDDLRNIQRRRATGSDRLPGSVLLARERLLERLRGVSVSENRQSSGSSSTTHQDDYFPPSEMTSRKNLNPGLAEEALNRLQLWVFSNDDETESLRECTICLEGFEDGDKLIRLSCMHAFHSCCLFPWVRVCGACPNCREAIVVHE